MIATHNRVHCHPYSGNIVTKVGAPHIDRGGVAEDPRPAGPEDPTASVGFLCAVPAFRSDKARAGGVERGGCLDTLPMGGHVAVEAVQEGLWQPA